MAVRYSGDVEIRVGTQFEKGERVFVANVRVPGVMSAAYRISGRKAGVRDRDPPSRVYDRVARNVLTVAAKEHHEIRMAADRKRGGWEIVRTARAPCPLE
jgi:hypothetical protein